MSTLETEPRHQRAVQESRWRWPTTIRSALIFLPWRTISSGFADLTDVALVVDALPK